MLASNGGQTETAEFIISIAKDVNKRNNFGETPLDKAKENLEEYRTK